MTDQTMGACPDHTFQRGGEPPVCLHDVLADDELLTRLGQRAPVPDAQALGRLLTSWVAELDVLAETDLATGVASRASVPHLVEVSSAATSRRRHVRLPQRPSILARGSRVAVTVAALGVGLASVTGVAAAVTGDPLAPYRPVVHGISAIGPDGWAASSPSEASSSATVADPASTAITERTRSTVQPGHRPSVTPDESQASASEHVSTRVGLRDAWFERLRANAPTSADAERRGDAARGDRPGVVHPGTQGRAEGLAQAKGTDDTRAGNSVPGDGDTGERDGVTTRPGQGGTRR